MSITLSWEDSERTIIRWTYSRDWTWEDAHQAVSIESRMVNQVEHTVYAVGDLRPTRIIPPGAMTNARSIMASRHPRIGLTILITDSYYVTTMCNMIQVVHRRLMQQSRIIVVATEQDAYAAIRSDAENTSSNMSG